MSVDTSPLTINAHFSKEDGCTVALDNDDQGPVDSPRAAGYRRLRSSLSLRSRSHGRVVRRSDGRSLIKASGLNEQRFKFVRDGFTTLINSSWYVILLFFTAVYILSWLGCGCVWTVVVYVDGDSNSTCLVNVDTFSAAFLFSIELQMTIGFGYKYVASDCHFGIFMLVVQSVIGLMIDSILLGLIFAKLTRPRDRRKTIVFSKVAVVYEENGQKVLEIRVGDIRRSQLVECHVRLQLYWYRLVDEVNDRYKFQQFDLDVGYDTGRDRIFLLTPVSIYHYIREDSPLHGLTASQLASSDLELVVILEGIVEATGLTAQALWSYTREEILFDREFVPMVSRRASKWEVDFSKIDQTVPLDNK